MDCALGWVTTPCCRAGPHLLFILPLGCPAACRNPPHSMNSTPGAAARVFNTYHSRPARSSPSDSHLFTTTNALLRHACHHEHLSQVTDRGSFASYAVVFSIQPLTSTSGMLVVTDGSNAFVDLRISAVAYAPVCSLASLSYQRSEQESEHSFSRTREKIWRLQFRATAPISETAPAAQHLSTLSGTKKSAKAAIIAAPQTETCRESVVSRSRGE